VTLQPAVRRLSSSPLPPRARRRAALGLTIAAAGLGCALWPSAGGGAPAPPGPGPLGPEGVPIPAGKPLAAPGRLTPGTTIDGIRCAPLEQLAFHVHAHLTIFIAGTARRVPAGVGIGLPLEGQATPVGAFVTGGSCISWLHTHAADGIIHIESPDQRRYTLGQFFDLWRLPLGPSRIGPVRGRVTAFLNGRRSKGDPRSLPLGAHSQIQLEIGQPLIAPQLIRFPRGL
jgi:hypothetical protein